MQQVEIDGLSAQPQAHKSGLFLRDLERAFGVTKARVEELANRLQLSVQSSEAAKPISPPEARSMLQLLGHRFAERAQRISLMMCKGGVGKTTVSHFLATRLADYGARVLVVDADPQGNLTSALARSQTTYQASYQTRLSITENTPVLLDVLSQTCQIDQAILKLSPNLHLIPSTGMNSLLDSRLSRMSSAPIFELHRALSLVDQKYDFVIIDSAPALNLINGAIMLASDRIILPLFMYEFSLMGLEQTLAEIKDCQAQFKFSTRVNILVNRFDSAEKWSLGYLGQIVSKHRSLILGSVVRSSSRLQTSISTGRSIFTFRDSPAKEDFDSLAREVLNIQRVQQ